MKNYYSELSLSPDLTIGEIQAELIQKERVWLQREVMQPEKARDMLSLITKAKAVFATEASRQEYDKQLEISQRGEVIPDPKKERLESFHQWKERAKNYSLDKQYDLAKVAIEKAISFNDNDDEDIEFLTLAAKIYEVNNEPDRGLHFINRAIISNPDNPYNYYIKGVILEKKASLNKKYNRSASSVDYAEARKQFHMAEGRMETSSDSIKSEILGSLAFSYFKRIPTNTTKAEEYAKKALALDKHNKNAMDIIFEYVLSAQSEREKAVRWDIDLDRPDNLPQKVIVEKNPDYRITIIEKAIDMFQGIEKVFGDCCYHIVRPHIETCEELIAEAKEEKIRRAEYDEQKATYDEARRKESQAVFWNIQLQRWISVEKDPDKRIKILIDAIDLYRNIRRKTNTVFDADILNRIQSCEHWITKAEEEKKAFEIKEKENEFKRRAQKEEYERRKRVQEEEIERQKKEKELQDKRDTMINKFHSLYRWCRRSYLFMFAVVILLSFVDRKFVDNKYIVISVTFILIVHLWSFIGGVSYQDWILGPLLYSGLYLLFGIPYVIGLMRNRMCTGEASLFESNTYRLLDKKTTWIENTFFRDLMSMSSRVEVLVILNMTLSMLLVGLLGIIIKRKKKFMPYSALKKLGEKKKRG